MHTLMRMAGEPRFDLGMLTGRIVVDNRMRIRRRWRSLVDLAQKVRELLADISLNGLLPNGYDCAINIGIRH
jgi:hypothetical protein